MLFKFIAGCVIAFILGAIVMAFCFNSLLCGQLRIDESRDAKDIFQMYFTKSPEKIKKMGHIMLVVKTGEHLNSQEN